jgi:hypothetical protein
LKHQYGSLARINVRAIELEVLCQSDEWWNVGSQKIKKIWLIAKMLSLKKYDSELCRHGLVLEPHSIGEDIDGAVGPVVLPK